MKIKHLLTNSLLGLVLVSGFTAKAQESKPIHPCNTYVAMEERFAKDPAAKVRYDNIQAILQKQYEEAKANKAAGKSAAAPVYTVPVVFHILHQGGSENIPDANCIAALNWVNLDFSRTNFDANSTDAPFNTSYVDSEIKFMLARKDPNGNCTNGIVRHIDSKTDWSQAQAFAGSYWTYTWDPTKYLNVYVVKQIIPTSTVTGGGIIVGYTFKPGTWPTGATQDAIVYRHDFLTGGDNPRSLTHEIGHWLNLAHTWGNTNNPGVACGDDGIADTPITMGEFSSCPTTSASACTQTNAAFNNLNNVENIMNYSSCAKNFTSDQTTAMRAALTSATSNRSNLWSPANLVATDVNNTPNCAPIADFMSTAAGDYTICAGQTLNLFKDFSFNASVITWSWSATNSATIASPTGSSTTMYFPTPGQAVVTLSVTGANGGSAKSRTVTVLDGAVTATTGIMESFEGSGPPSNWSIVNPGGVGWVQTSNAACVGAFSMLLDGAISSSLSEDFLYMPTMDFVANPGATLRFAYAYRRKSATHADIFKVQLSSDCGGSWKDVYAPSASNLASGSGGVGTGNFIPTASEWKVQDVSNHPNYSSFFASTSVMGRFYFQEGSGGFGNKLYIDSVNLVAAASVIGVNELSRHLRLTLSPNPTNSSANVNFVLSNDANVKLTVIDATGKIVGAERTYNLKAGDHTITVNENATLSKGIYVVSLQYNGTKVARKLVIE
jgi:hypothetical protein